MFFFSLDIAGQRTLGGDMRLLSMRLIISLMFV